MQAIDELLELRRELAEKISALDTAIDLLRAKGEQNEQSNPKRVGHPAATATPHDGRFKKVGLTDACRDLTTSEWKAPSIIRDELINGGFKQTDKRKLLAAVFATLKRLAKGQNAILEGAKIDGIMKYRKLSRPVAVNHEDAAA